MNALSDNHATLRIERPADAILVATLNRPERRNAFDTQMAAELLGVFQALAHDPGAVRAVVLTGAGDKAFCAGADLKERLGLDAEAWHAQHAVFEDMAGAIRGCPLPVIGAVNGAAFGGGCELAMACDFAYAAAHARFALSETTLGLIPGIGGTQMLPRRVGPARAKEILLTGAAFDATEALDWGLVNRVCPAEALRPAALETAERIAGNAPLAVRQALRAVDEGLTGSLEQGLAVERDCYRTLVGTEDLAEGVAAFNAKRQPTFNGR